MREKIVAGNWKMNLRREEAQQLVTQVLEALGSAPATVVFGVPFPYLEMVGKMIAGRHRIFLAAQNCHHEEKGAFTGEVSADMLTSVGAQWVILGHSERRQYFRESNALLAKKIDIALRKNLRPIFCCGEPLPVREKGTHIEWVARQLRASLFHLPAAEFFRIVVAYEPIWAIGTGRTASSAQAQEMHAALRQVIAKKYGRDLAHQIPILYGGSCNAGNAAELFRQPDVDGGLIGGASLKSSDFLAIVAAAT